MNKWKTLRKLVIVTFISSMVLLFLTEVAIRTIPLIPDHIPIAYREMPGAERFAPLPKSSAVSILGISYEVNSLGLRSPERPIQRREDSVRILLLGDSVTFGYGVDVREIFACKLEKTKLAGKSVETWNLGVQASNVFNHRARYERLAPILKPQITLVILLYNDLGDKATQFRITSVNTLSNPKRHSPFPDSWRPFLEKIALYHFAVRCYARFEQGHRQLSRMEYLDDLTTQLDGIIAVANEIDSVVLLASVPGQWPPLAQYREFADSLAAYAADKEVAFVDLDIALGNPVDPGLFLPVDPIHPNAKGHTRIAQSLHSALDGIYKK